MDGDRTHSAYRHHLLLQQAHARWLFVVNLMMTYFGLQMRILPCVFILGCVGSIFALQILPVPKFAPIIDFQVTFGSHSSTQ